MQIGNCRVLWSFAVVGNTFDTSQICWRRLCRHHGVYVCNDVTKISSLYSPSLKTTSLPPCFLLNCCYSPPDHRNRCSWKTQALQATYPTGLRVRWIIESPETTGGLVWVLSWQTQQVTSVVIVPRFYCPTQLSWRCSLKSLALSTSIWMLLWIALWDVVSTWSINRTARWSFCLLSTRFYLVFTRFTFYLLVFTFYLHVFTFYLLAYSFLPLFTRFTFYVVVYFFLPSV